MVDALRRAHRIVKPDGVVVDLHPAASQATVEIGDAVMGTVDGADAPLRHAAAGAAIAAVVGEGLFAIEHFVEFPFFTYADTIDELREYIEENWRNARIAGTTIDATRAAAQRFPGARPRSRERVLLTVLRPLSRSRTGSWS